MWPNPQETDDLVTFTEEIFHGKLIFFRSVACEVSEFCVRFSPLFLYISVIGCFMWLGNSKLDVGIPKAPFLVLFFSCYLLMTFQVKLFTIMLWMVMILLSDMWQQFKLASELDPDLVSVDFSKSTDTILWKWSGLFVIKKTNKMVCWDCLFRLNCIELVTHFALLKLLQRKRDSNASVFC